MLTAEREFSKSRELSTSNGTITIKGKPSIKPLNLSTLRIRRKIVKRNQRRVNTISPELKKKEFVFQKANSINNREIMLKVNLNRNEKARQISDDFNVDFMFN